MPYYIAFLRGINVGGHRVKMDRLKALFDDMGFHDVTSFLASGNVVFTTGSDDPGELRGVIEGRLADALGYSVETFLRRPARLAEIVDHAGDSGFETAGWPAHYVVLLHEAPSPRLRSELADLESDSDRFTFDGHEVHWWIRGKMSESPLFAGVLDRVLKGVPNTMRNANTLRRIVARTKGGPP